MRKIDKLQLLGLVFTPAAPIENIEFFRGREPQLLKIKEAIEERGQHAVMYGGRGVGKTSLANVLDSFFENVLISKVTCNRTDNFRSLWEKAIRKIKLIQPNKAIGFSGKETEQVIELSLPDAPIDASILEEIVNFIPENVLFVFDEFDSISDPDTKIKMADTIKAFSDNLPQATILIIGIADNVNQLIGEHPSLERCIMQIQIPAMNHQEAMEVIDGGLKNLGLKMEQTIAQRIVEYAAGFPNYVHSLCKFAARNAIEEGKKIIGTTNFDFAVYQSIQNSTESLISSYEKATASTTQKNQFQEVILACSLCSSDDSGTFSSEEIVSQYNALTQQQVGKEAINYNIGMLCKSERGAILQKTTKSRNTRYKFANPLMKAFVRLKLHTNL